MQSRPQFTNWNIHSQGNPVGASASGKQAVRVRDVLKRLNDDGWVLCGNQGVTANSNTRICRTVASRFPVIRATSGRKELASQYFVKQDGRHELEKVRGGNRENGGQLFRV